MIECIACSESCNDNAGHSWRNADIDVSGKENTMSPHNAHASHSPARRVFEGLHVNVDL